MDLAAYFERIAYDGPRAPTPAVLGRLHALHPAAIPFENIDPFLGRPVPIDARALEDKLVRRRRGGYCFEQNGLFLQALSALGFQVTPLAARVRWMVPESAPQTPLSHMLLKVRLGEDDFICDVGFGGQSPTAPLRLEPGSEQATPHGIYRFAGLVCGFELQMRLPAGWSPMYRFTEEPQGARDYEVFNWFTATNPSSRFLNNFVAARATGEGRFTLLNDEWTFQHPDGRREQRRLADASDMKGSLARDFGLAIEQDDVDCVWSRLPGQGTS